jgi:hypothetical protein
MTNDERVTKLEARSSLKLQRSEAQGPAHNRPVKSGDSSFGFRHSLVIRYSSFVIPLPAERCPIPS